MQRANWRIVRSTGEFGGRGRDQALLESHVSGVAMREPTDNGARCDARGMPAKLGAGSLRQAVELNMLVIVSLPL